MDVGIAKARTAAIFRRPSKVFEDRIRDGRVAASRYLAQRHCRAASTRLMDELWAQLASVATRRKKMTRSQ